MQNQGVRSANTHVFVTEVVSQCCYWLFAFRVALYRLFPSFVHFCVFFFFLSLIYPGSFLGCHSLTVYILCFTIYKALFVM